MLGWLTKVVISLAVLGLLAFDGLALVTARVSAADHAAYAASAAADEYRASKNLQAAYNAASAVAAKNAETIDAKTFLVLPADGRVTLTLRKTATTLWLHRVGPLKKLGEVSAVGEGSPPLG